MKTLKYIRDSEFLRQTLMYAVTAFASFCSDFALYWFFSLFLHYQIATFIALCGGLFVNYVLSKYWVFKRNSPLTKRELFSFLFFTAVGFLLTALGMYIGVDIIKANDKIVKIIVSVIVSVINFIVRKYIIFI